MLPLSGQHHSGCVIGKSVCSFYAGEGLSTLPKNHSIGVRPASAFSLEDTWRQRAVTAYTLALFRYVDKEL